MGPVFTREAVTAPRRPRLYLARGAYVAALLVILCTAWLVLAGTQVVRNLGDLARFGAIAFQILAPLQLGVMTFFAALSAASAVAVEKDRRTLVLLLLTRLTNSELVLGKLLASLLQVFSMLAAAAPIFMLLTLFGGISLEQIGRTLAVTLVSAAAAGSIGSTFALWREKTFQTLAFTAITLFLWLAVGQVVASGVWGESWLGVSAESWGIAVSPVRAVMAATLPEVDNDPALGALHSPVNLFLIFGASLAALLNLFAIGMVRVWNPSREARQSGEDPTRESIWGAEFDLMRAATAKSDGATAPPLPDHAGERTIADLAATAAQRRTVKQEREHGTEAAGSRRVRTREVWDNPIVWREIRTWAYGRKMIAIRVAYLLLASLAAAAIYFMAYGDQGLTRYNAMLTLVPLFVVSLILVNAQAVTSLTSERDAKALDLLLVTDITPKEFVYGKLGGVFYNTKEMVLAPMLLCVFLWAIGWTSLENLVYVVGGLSVMNVFVAMLGVHSGMTYENSRGAIGASLGTVFFLFLGVAICIRMMVAFSGSFQFQLLPFAAMIFGGGVGLFVSLGSRNPSTAIALASVTCPFATFYAITSSVLEPPQTLGVFLIVALAYGFTTAAMLVPALYEFDVATGRTTADE